MSPFSEGTNGESPKHTMSVQKLTDAEIKQLADAKKKLEDAQAEYDAIAAKVKSAHGAMGCPDTRLLVACTGNVSVTLWGDYALIDAATWTPTSSTVW